MKEVIEAEENIVNHYKEDIKRELLGASTARCELPAGSAARKQELNRENALRKMLRHVEKFPFTFPNPSNR